MLPWRKLQAGLANKDGTKGMTTVINQATNNAINNFNSTPTLIQQSISQTIYGDVVIGCLIFDGSTSVATGDAKNGNFFRIPSKCDGFNIVGVAANVFTAGSAATTDIQLRNVTDAADVLSTKITIDGGETDSKTAATAAVIDTTKDDVINGDKFTWDVDAVNTSAPKGLYCEVTLRKP